MRSRRITRLLGLASLAALSLPLNAARAVITLGTGNNYTAAPNGVENYEGFFNGSFTGTIISSNYIIAATHTFGSLVEQFQFNDSATGGTAQTFNMQVVGSLDDQEIWQIVPGQTDSLGHAAVFPSSQVVPIYTGSSELGASLTDVGRGFARGGATTGGWFWAGSGQGPFSWGTNNVSAVLSDTQLGASGALGGDYLEFDFNNNGNPNEAVLTTFDSGGGLFINVNGTYELAGVNTSVLLFYTAPNTSPLQAAIYDANGYYQQTGSNTWSLITGHPSQPSFASRVSSKANFIETADGAISPSGVHSAPITVDPNGFLNILSNMTTGAIIGGGAVQVGSNAVTATLQIAPNSGGSEINALSLFNGGGHNSTLDLTNNHIIIDGGSDPTLEASILQYLQSGYNNGLWNGPGINSSTAAASGGIYGVGFAEANDLAVPGLSAGQAEVAYALYGDCNLDQVVNGIDFGIIAANFNKGVSSGWEQGDFDYNGVVNGIDFGLLAINFNKGASGTSAQDLAALEQFVATNGIDLNVPEPATTAILLSAAVAITSRRRRQSN